MDKQTYETYEFLPANTVDNNLSQFLVVQENGTFLVNRPIQYVTQVQDVKEVLNGVYDASSQQFYVDANNAEELISTVSDQFIAPGSENNVYSNGFYLQPVTNGEQEDVEEHNITEYKEELETITHVDGDAENDDNKTNGDCTEITLSDDQYQYLEQKGWVLLETNDKILVLNTLGLHDITSDKKLIQKLKSEIETDNNQAQIASNIANTNGNVYDNSNGVEMKEEELVHFVMADEEVTQNEESTQEVTVDNQEPFHDLIKHPVIKEESELDRGNFVQAQHCDKINNLNNPTKKDNGTIKIKTKYLFKDIPPEIVLGKTVNGKKLVARVIKTEKPANDSVAKPMSNSEQNSNPTCNGLSESQFENLIQQCLNKTAEKCGIKEVSAAETVVHQLLRVTAFKPAVVGRHLIITKVILLEDETGRARRERTPTLVMGRVVDNCHGGWRFICVPDMLKQIIEDEEKMNLSNISKDPDEGSFLHIHILETKGTDGIVRISITLNKRHLPLKVMNSIKPRQPRTVFACSTCAAVYQTEQGLRVHQEAECMDTDDALIIETERSNIKKTYSVISSGKDKRYICIQCHSVFSKLSNCQMHVRTHFNQGSDEKNPNNGNTQPSSKPEIIYKCKMCPSTYLHAATLSKHIVSKHIKVKSK